MTTADESINALSKGGELLVFTPKQARNWDKKFVRKSTEECWVWTGTTDDDGYGRFYLGKKRGSAHRIAHRVYKGEIPAGLCVCHSCDNPPCVNPAHLWLGTNIKNIQDKVGKGRQAKGLGITSGRNTASGDRSGPRLHPERMARGSQNGMRIHAPKLTIEKAREIRMTTGRRGTDANLARKFGVSTATISDVRTGRTWFE